jgi:CubicO group peptidase (beta-lactamase class C family)
MRLPQRIRWLDGLAAALTLGLLAPIIPAALADDEIPGTQPPDPVVQLHDSLASGGASNMFGGVVVVGHDDEQVLADGYGLQLASGDPYTADTPFSIASLGKMFTAVAMGQLLDAGQLALDDTVGTYVDGLPSDVADATIAQFLSHASGLGDSIEDGIVGEPGTFRYTNAGYDVLARVLEAVTGETLSSYLDSHVFGPTGMSDTSLPAETPGEDPIGSGGETSTGPDLLRFVEALLGDRLLTPQTTDLFTSPKVETDQGTRYGYGFEIFGDPTQRPSIGHWGSSYPFLGWVLANDARRYALVALCDRGCDSMGDSILAFLDAAAVPH